MNEELILATLPEKILNKPTRASCYGFCCPSQPKRFVYSHGRDLPAKVAGGFPVPVSRFTGAG